LRNPQVGPPVSSVATFLLATTTVGCLVNYPSGGHEGGFFTITVQDTTAPQIVTPGNLTGEEDSRGRRRGVDSARQRSQGFHGMLT